jgi:hypothetical protein
MPTGGAALHAYLSDEARQAWDILSFDNGVSVTGLLEAVALELIDDINDNDGSAEGLRPEWVKLARTTDANRRRRGRNR